MAADKPLDLQAMRKQAEQAMSNKPPQDGAKDLIPREIPLQVTYTEPGTGNVLRATLISRIMTGEERRLVSHLEVGLAAPLNVSALSVPAQNRNHAQAVCTAQLREPPGWVLKYIAEDDALLFSIFGALEGHNNRYFFRDGGTGEGDTPSQQLAVTSPLDPKPAAQRNQPDDS
jgi:hypothetical protein